MRKVIFPLALALALPASAVTNPKIEPTWLYGAWTVEHDEDNTPADVMAFIPGKYVGYGFNCAYRAEQPFHFHAGDVYVTTEFPKGPVAIVFRPNADKTRLTFTSPRTRNNAIYKKLDKNPCE